jgi:hypothetical protein
MSLQRGISAACNATGSPRRKLGMAGVKHLCTSHSNECTVPTKCTLGSKGTRVDIFGWLVLYDVTF